MRKLLGSWLWRVTQTKKLFSNLNEARPYTGTLSFPLDGNIELALPKVTPFSLISGRGRRRLVRLARLIGSRTREPMLRALVNALYETAYLEREKTLVDVGAFVGDNSLPWSANLVEPGMVIAVDPSRGNMRFGREISALNGIGNIRWVSAVCGAFDRQILVASGDIDHTSFANKSRSPFLPRKRSARLDSILPAQIRANVGLLHLDVEGMEEAVLRGAERLIEESRPTIIFESQGKDSQWRNINDLLLQERYEIFEINESAGANPDCKNYIAFDVTRKLPDFDQLTRMVMSKFSQEGLAILENRVLGTRDSV